MLFLNLFPGYIVTSLHPCLGQNIVAAQVYRLFIVVAGLDSFNSCHYVTTGIYFPGSKLLSASILPLWHLLFPSSGTCRILTCMYTRDP